MSATGACYLHKAIADVTTTHLVFPGGVSAHVFVSWLHPFKEQKLVVVGDGGMAVFDDREPWASKLLFYPHTIGWQSGMPEPEQGDAEPVALEPAEPLRLECQHFLDCIADGGRPRTERRRGCGCCVLDASERSLTTGRVLSLDGVDAEPLCPATPRRGPPPGVQVHPTAVVDDDCVIGAGTRIWHFSHVLSGSRIGADCTLGQNVVVGPDVTIGDRCKIQNNVSVYDGVTLD